MSLFQKLPKIELHQHLDCSLSYAVVSKIDPQISAAEYREKFIAPPKCNNLADFLSRAPQGIRLMQTERNLQLVTFDLFEQLRQDNIIYAEIRFAPLLHTELGLTPQRVVEVIEKAVSQAGRETGIEARLILSTLRNYSEQQSLETVQLARQFQNSRVAGFDIAGDEAGYPIDAHVRAFEYAARHGIPCSAHAGEARGPESVRETLDRFHPARLGHGVRSIEDPDLLVELREKGIHLEVCPTCNIQTDVFDRYEDHPVDRLYREGISLGINTDTRTITNITLTREYQKLHDVFGWTEEHFLQCNRNALKAAFISESLKSLLRERLESGYR